MKWLIIGLVLVVFLMFYKNIKHHFVRKGFKYAIVIILLVAGLFMLNYYVDVADLFEEGKGFTEFTGASVKDAFDGAFESDIISDAKDKVKDFISD